MVAGRFEFIEGTTPTTTPSTGEWYLYFKSDGLYIKKDDGTEVRISQTNNEINVNASTMYPSTTAGASAVTQVEYTTNDVDLNVIDFDQASDEFAQFSVWLPDDYGGGTITFKVIWTASAGSASETVAWVLQGRAFADDDAIDQAWGTGITVSDTLIATGDIHISAVSSAVTLAGSPAGGQFAQFRIGRDVSEDNLAGDARLIGIKLYYSL